jgi:hypothetical protein
MSHENTLQGWVPVQFETKSGEMLFRWMDFSSVDISEPFFRQTVKKMVKLGSRTKNSRVQDLITIGSRIAAIRPSCLIFHVSRCGSTLLTNALRAAGNCIALSEPDIITDLFHSRRDLPATALEQRDSILQSMVNLYATYQGTQRNMVVKLASTNLLSLHAIQKVWPETPCILLIRDPGEVVISNLKPGGWLAYRSHPAYAASVLGMDEIQVAEMSDIEFCTRAIQRLNEAALEGVDNKWMIIDYNMLNFALMPAIVEFIGLDRANLNWEAMQSTFHMYSKDEDGIKVFEDDREEKRANASQLIASSNANLAKKSYDLLLQMSLANLPHNNENRAD